MKYQVCNLNFIFILLLVFSKAAGQGLPLTKLSNKDGISIGLVYDILQDREDFIWFATKDGLHHFDGAHLKIFSNDPSYPFSISDNHIKKLFEDSRGYLWVTVEGKGISVFDKSTERFYHIRTKKGGSNGLSNNFIRGIVEDKNGLIWAVGERGIDKMLLPEKIHKDNADWTPFIQFEYFQPKNSESQAQIKTIQTTEDNTIIIGFKNGLSELADGKIKIIDLPGNEKDAVTDVNSILPLGNEYYLLSRSNSQILWNRKTNEKKLFHFPLRLINDKTYSLTIDNKQRIWLTDDVTIWQINLAELMKGDFVPRLVHRVQLGGVNKLFHDKRGVIWIGTNGFGIYQYNTFRENFNKIFNDGTIVKVHKDNTGNLWTKRPASSFKVFDQFNKEIFLNSAFVNESTEVFAMANGKAKEELWFLIKQKNETSLIKYNLSNQNHEPFKHEGPVGNTQMICDESGDLWFCGTDGNLWQFKREASVFLPYFISENIEVNALCQDANGHFWIGHSDGLIRTKIVESRISVEHFQFNLEKKSSLSNNFVLSISDDPLTPKKYLWIGTKGGGLNRFDKENETFESFKMEQGLPNNTIYAILPDKANNLWMSTNRGISQLNLETTSFQNYTVEDGLQGNEFNINAYFGSEEGELIFGGSNGLNRFYPERLLLDVKAPKTFIIGLKVKNESINYKDGSQILNKPIQYTDAIKLSHSQNMISIEFSALDYAVITKNKYRYRLLGLHDDWIYSGNSNVVQYSFLNAGTYTFEAQGTNSIGIWSENIARLTITIHPPWWASTYAYFAYLVLLASLVYAIFRFQMNRLKLKNQLAFEQKEAERLAEMDKMKSNFFSNITHEFRTPLTLIIEPLRQALENQNLEEKEKIKLAHNNSQKLLRLINQLLDLFKLEHQKMKVKLKRGDILEVISPIVSSFTPLAEQKGIELKYQVPKSLPSFDFDKDKVEKILFNLISNAIKFTEQGSVELSVYSQEKTESPTATPNGITFLLLTVSDTGIGISAEKQKHIFDRFYQIDDSSTRKQQGTGIGLALTKELVGLMGGKIELESELGKGSTFKVFLPLSNVSEGSENHKITDTSAPIVVETPNHIVSQINPDAGNIALVIEDNAEMRKFIVESLQDSYQVLEADNGTKGLEIAKQTIPNVIISDIMMPEMDGFEVCKQLKTDDKTSHIPIILLTAKTALNSKIQGLKYGADAYLTKPFDTRELLVRMEKLVELRQLLRIKFSQQLETETRIPELSEYDQNFLNNLDEVIQENLDNELLSVEILSKKVAMSRAQLHRKLRALLDQSPSEFIRNYRLREAMQLLKTKKGNVTEVAFMVGFSSQKYFSTRFKEKYGISPKEVK